MPVPVDLLALASRRIPIVQFRRIFPKMRVPLNCRGYCSPLRVLMQSVKSSMVLLLSWTDVKVPFSIDELNRIPMLGDPVALARVFSMIFALVRFARSRAG